MMKKNPQERLNRARRPVQFKHVQYTQSESIRLRHLTIRLDSHDTSRLDSHGVASRKSTSGMTNRQQGKRFVSIFDRIDSNRQHFQPTLYSPPEVKISEITIHEPSSFLKRGHKLQSIRTIRVDSIDSTRIDNIFNPPSKPRSTILSKSRANRLPACQIDGRGNDSCRFDRVGFTNRYPVCRIANTKDESTLVGCIGQPSLIQLLERRVGYKLYKT